MNDKDFDKLLESVNQMGAIMRGENIPHRSYTAGKVDVKSLRAQLDLTQAAFAVR